MSFRFAAPIALAVAAMAFLPSIAQASSLHTYRYERTAQRHCPHDQVVWLNLPTGIYHFRGERWYAHTKDGAFVCRREADANGDRASMNGQ